MPRAVTALDWSARLARRVPRVLAEPLAAGAGRLAARRDPMRWRTVCSHQRRILSHVAGRPVTDEEVTRSAKAVFANVGRAWVDAARVHREHRAELEAGIDVDGWEHVAAARSAGRPVIMAMAHVGAWDRGGTWLSARIPLTIVAERLEPPEVFEWFVSQREAAGMKVIGLDDTAGAKLLAELKAGRSLGLLCDRDLTGDGVEVSFFGAPARLPTGPALLALRTGAVLLPCAVALPCGRHPAPATIAAPVDTARTPGAGHLRADVARVTQALASELEALIGRTPDQWLVLQPHWLDDAR